MPTKDPRSYVRTLPLPITSQHGVKIQARSSAVYNPMTPTREDVRKHNYDRRMMQMNQQGFRSLNYKPYQGIGDPFYLEEQKLILHALGQLEESSSDDSCSSSEDEDIPEQVADTKSAAQKSLAAAKFVLRRTRKDLNTLNKEVAQGRNLIRNVKLGHGLFDLIQQQRKSKKAAAAAESKKKADAARNAWQPPKLNSSSDDETDEELDEDVDLSSYMVLNSVKEDNELVETKTPSVVIPESKVIAEEPSSATDDMLAGVNSAISRPSTTGTGRKKKVQPPRPYTAQHTNIVSDSVVGSSKEALFRQLCVLNWLLEAMNVEPPNAMGPITTSWHLTDIGGAKTTTKKLQKEKQSDTKWDQFVSHIQLRQQNKRFSTSKTGKHPTSRRSLYPRNSIHSSISSPSGSSTQLNMTGQSTGSQAAKPENTIPEEPALPTMPEAEEDPVLSKSIFKFLDEYYESMKQQEGGGGDENRSCDDTKSIKSDLSPSAHRKRDRSFSETDSKSGRKSGRKTPEVSRRLESIRNQETLDRLNAAIGREDRMSSRALRADHLIRPKSSPALLEFQSTLPSNRHGTLLGDMRIKFAEVREDKALTLHDILEQMDRQRQVICKNKFMTMKTANSSFYRALEQMRSQSANLMHRAAQQQLRKKSHFKGNWYTELLDVIPTVVKEEWYYKVILDKLAKYGLVEGNSKQSVYKFLKVLSTLREWEMCSPDISAAVEFCREKIVEMTVEEYEDWFRQQFPQVTRPQTAPPAVSKGKDKNSNVHVKNSNRAQSAVVFVNQSTRSNSVLR